MESRDDAHSQEEVKKPAIAVSAEQFHRSMVDGDDDQGDNWKRSIGVRAYRFTILLMDGFSRTELTRRAAALTYTTILSIFPILAVLTSMLAIFYTPEKEQDLMAVISRTLLPSGGQTIDLSSATNENERNLAAQQNKFNDGIREMFTNVSRKFRENAGGVGIFGFIGVLITAGLLYYSIESVVNQTWQTSPSQWTDIIRNFILVLLFAPIVIGLSMTASGMAVTLFSQQTPNHVTEAAITAAPTTAPVTAAERPEDPAEAVHPEKIDFDSSATLTAEQTGSDTKGFVYHIRKVTTRFGFMLPLIPLLLNTIILTVAYGFLPNAKVGIKAAFAGGATAAVLWELARSLFFYYVYMSTVNRTLADALGLTVIFLIWVYITWMILLVGNLVAYVSQYYRGLWAERRTGGEMMLDGRLLVVYMLLVARRFQNHGPALFEHEIRSRLGLRKNEFESLTKRLIRAGYISRQENGAYQMNQPADDVRLQDLVSMGCNLAKLPMTNRLSPVSQTLRQLQEGTMAEIGDRRLSDLLKVGGQ